MQDALQTLDGGSLGLSTAEVTQFLSQDANTAAASSQEDAMANTAVDGAHEGTKASAAVDGAHEGTKVNAVLPPGRKPDAPKPTVGRSQIKTN